MLKEIKIDDLRIAEYNPRVTFKKGDKRYTKLKQSLEEFGQAGTIVVNSDMTVISGHQRLAVMRDLGFKTVECKVVDLDKTKEKALNLALNKIDGEWDNDKLALVINDIMVSDVDISISGFDNIEVANLAIEIENSTKSNFLDDVIEEAGTEEKIQEGTTAGVTSNVPPGEIPIVEREYRPGLEALNKFAEKTTEQKFEITLKFNKKQKENFINAVEKAKNERNAENTYDAVNIICEEWIANEKY